MNNMQGNDARCKKLLDKSDMLRMEIEETKNSLNLKASDDPYRIIIGEELRELRRKHLGVIDELEAIGGVLREEDKQARGEYHAAMDDHATDMAEYDALVRGYCTSLNEPAKEEAKPDNDEEAREEKSEKPSPLAILIVVIIVVFGLMIIGTRIFHLLFP